MADDLGTTETRGGRPAGVRDDFQDFVFYRDLAEIHLLLDNVSMSFDKTLPSDDGGDVVEQVCEIGWPPEGSKLELAHKAATLLKIRDALNRAAAPATGATIAFTLLVTGEYDLGERDAKAAERGPAWSLTNGWIRGVPSRLELARAAFPSLVRQARVFRLFIPLLVGGLFAVFLATSWLSWNIAVGNSLLAEWTKVRATVSQDAPNAAATAPAVRARTGVPPGAADDLNAQREEANDRDLRFAGANLNNWLDTWRLIGPPGAVACDSATCPPAAAITVNEMWAGALLNVLGGAVLPGFYGLLGAGAAVVRSMSARIRESLLSPRHLPLSFVQLTLGAVIGGCIGLFVTPSGAPSSATPGLLGSVALSASALCFIAGFGVDGVFLALESLIRRVFSIADPTKKPSAA